MYALNHSHLALVNLFFETSKERIPEYLTTLGDIIYSEINPRGERVYLFIDIRPADGGRRFRLNEVRLLATGETNFKDAKGSIYQGHNIKIDEDIAQLLHEKLGPLSDDEIYVVADDLHMDKLKAEAYLATLLEWFTAHPLAHQRIYNLSSDDESKEHVLALYGNNNDGAWQQALQCINLRDFAIYGLLKPRKSFDHNTWFDRRFQVLKDLVRLQITGHKSLLPEALESIQSFPYLTDLDLSDNNLDTIPPGLESLVNLKRVSLKHNRYTGMGELTHLKQLRKLDLSDNSITAIPTDISTMESLQILNLSGNAISELPTDLRHCNPGLLTRSAGQLLNSFVYIYHAYHAYYAYPYYHVNRCLQNIAAVT